MGFQMEEEETVITMETEDGEEFECIIITVLDVADKKYAVLMPKDQEDEEEPEIGFYRYSEDGDEIILDSVEDDDEFDQVEEAFNNLLDTIADQMEQ